MTAGHIQFRAVAVAVEEGITAPTTEEVGMTTTTTRPLLTEEESHIRVAVVATTTTEEVVVVVVVTTGEGEEGMAGAAIHREASIRDRRMDGDRHFVDSIRSFVLLCCFVNNFSIFIVN
jgi:hypothetical protein